MSLPTRIATATALLAALAIAGPAAAQAGDAAKGKVTFARCGICHSMTAGENKLGPSLAGVIGRKSGTLPGFAYSPAMKAKAIVWDAKSLDTYLTKPATMVPGTKMIFAGLPNPADRANVIAYLKAGK